MSGRIALVTDSTAYLPPELLAPSGTGPGGVGGIRVVPVQVIIAGTSYAEGIDVTPAEVAAALRAFRPVTTSRPAPEDFAAAYAAAAAAGATGVVSVHLSAELSGTYESAVLAARSATIEVRVVDSRTVGMALGYAVLAGERAAGATIDEVEAAVRAEASRTVAYFYVDTLEYLRRGGRIGAAAAFFGSALAVKPLLHVVDGRVTPYSKVRTSARALAQLEELVVGSPGSVDGEITVHHLDASARAVELAGRLQARLPGARIRVIEVGAVVGAHVGPGMVAVVIA
ncbi:MAG: DegV family protein [Actinomycetes bacterium]